MESKNIFAAVLAGGVGTRMGNVDKPKQFLNIAAKPIIIHTIEKFVINSRFEAIIVLTPKQWVNNTKDLVKKYIPAAKNVFVIEGGASRSDTIMNAIEYIENNYRLDEETVIVTHDSVRPFVSHRIIEENIDATLEYGACDTVIPATDTIIRSDDNTFINDVPPRKVMYQGQTPQSFRAKKLKEHYNSLSEDEKEQLTDACKIFVLKGEKVALVDGEISNMKVTYPYDLKVAEALLGGNE